MKKTLIWIYFLLVSLLVLQTKLSISQPPNGGGNPPGGSPSSPPTLPPGGNPAGSPCFDSECVPIDGGVIFLILAGVFLVIRIHYNNKNTVTN